MQMTVFPPQTTSDVIHGLTVSDPYRWLEDRNSSATQAWIEHQRETYGHYLAGCDRTDALRTRVHQFLSMEEFQQPVKTGDRLFYLHRKRDGEQARICRMDLNTGGERMLFDPAIRGIFASVQIHQVKPDGSLLAFEVADGGSDAKEIHFLDTDKGVVFPEYLASGRPRGIVFFSDNTGFYYGHDEVNDTSAHSIRAHRFGEGQEEDWVILSMPRVGISKLIVMADSVHLGALYLHEHDGEIMSDFYLASRTVDTAWKLVAASLPAASVPILRHGRIFLYSHGDASNETLVELCPGLPQKTLIPKNGVTVQSVSIRDKYLYSHHFDGYEGSLHVWNMAGEYLRAIRTPSGGTIRPCLPYGSADDTLFYSHESFDSPSTIFRYDPETTMTIQWSARECPTKSGSSTSLRSTYVAKDGTRIPITLVTKSHFPALRDRFVIMTSYGGFGVAATPRFSVLVTILLELGAVFVLSHIRGGAENGTRWHEAARGKNRQVSFDDFISAAEWLCGEGITDPKKLAIFGGSNSGLLVAVAMTQRPDLFRAVLCIAALLDMARYDHFGRARKWQKEYGATDNPEDFFALHSYSPYHHVKETVDYPSTLLVSGDQDDRCDPSHSRKMAALLQGRPIQRNPILMDYTSERGHAPGLPLSVRIDALTFRIAFLCRELGIDIPRSFEDVAISL